MSSRGTWARVVDPAVGVVEMREVSHSTGEIPQASWVIRRCGKAVAAVTKIATHVRDREAKDPSWYPIHCEQIGVFVECRQDGLNAGDLDVTFRFDLRAAGFMLAGVAVVELGIDATQAQQGFDAEITKDERCPGYQPDHELDPKPTGGS